MQWGRLPVFHKAELCGEGKDCPEDSSALEGVLAYGGARIKVHLQIRLSLYFSDSLKKIIVVAFSLLESQ